MKLKSVSSLHAHWCTAEAVKQCISLPCAAAAQVSRAGAPHAGLRLAMEQIAALARLQLWYALLYVVVEGYQELEERDEAVDALLANRAMVTAMKGFHHASFQAQEVPFSGQMLRFIAHPDSDQWPGKLHAALRQYFETRTDARELVRHFTGEL